MIIIKQRQEGYRICIKEEEWAVKTRKELDSLLKILLDLKDKNGRLKE
jgi:hypothetical protein